MSLTEIELEIFRNTFNHCVSEREERKRFYIHGVFGFGIAILAILSAVVSTVGHNSKLRSA